MGRQKRESMVKLDQTLDQLLKDLGGNPLSPTPTANINKTNALTPGQSPWRSQESLSPWRPHPQNEEYTPTLPQTVVGTFSNHGIQPAGQGSNAKTNQDRGAVEWPFEGDRNSALFCVMDGHGENGAIAAEFCVDTLVTELSRRTRRLRAKPQVALREAYDAVEKHLRKDFRQDCRKSGTTSSSVFMREGKLWVANLGDSRAVLARSNPSGGLLATDLSEDHKPDDPQEKARLTAAGGEVEEPDPQYSDVKVWTPALADQNEEYGLSMSRCFGDFTLKEYGVSSEAVVTCHEIQNNDMAVIVASDGVWEVLSSQEVVNIVHENSRDATQACSRLIQQATQRWRDEEGPYRDDITAIVVMLQPLQLHMAGGADENAAAGGLVKPGNTRRGPLETDLFNRSSEGSDGVEKENFRGRRLSMSNTRGGDELLKENVQSDSNVDAPVVGPKKESRRRRASLVPDMDAGGQRLQPNFSANARAANVSSSV